MRGHIPIDDNMPPVNLRNRRTPPRPPWLFIIGAGLIIGVAVGLLLITL